MTEAEWLASTDPHQMLASVGARASDRKLRLFAAACCRRIWQLLPNEPSRRVVEAVERYADGLATDEELGVAEGEFSFADWDRRSGYSDTVYAYATEAVGQAARDRRAPQYAWEAAAGASDQASSAAAGLLAWSPGGRAAELSAQAVLFRDIFGPLLFRPVGVTTSVIAWNGGTVRSLAEAAYNERVMPVGTLDPARLAVLADALEEAGCHNDLLGHLRGPGSHVRGCWAVDALLGMS